MRSEGITENFLIEKLLLPSFLGGNLKHDEDVTKNLPLMLEELSEEMNNSVNGKYSKYFNTQYRKRNFQPMRSDFNACPFSFRYFCLFSEHRHFMNQIIVNIK